MRKIGFVIFTALMAFAGCKEIPYNGSNNSDNGQYTVKDFFPLKVGNMWVYQSAYCDAPGEADCVYYRNSIETLRVVAEHSDTFMVENTHRDSIYGYATNTHISIYTDTSYYYFQYGVITGHCLSPELNLELCRNGWVIFKGPLIVGKNNISSIGSQCTVPAGTFYNCLSICGDSRGNNGYSATETTFHKIYAFGVGELEDYRYYHDFEYGPWNEYYIQLIAYQVK